MKNVNVMFIEIVKVHGVVIVLFVLHPVNRHFYQDVGCALQTLHFYVVYFRVGLLHLNVEQKKSDHT